MQYKFHAFGHPNISGKHKTTLEFTKHSELSLNGDCVVGVNADFELKQIKRFMEKSKAKKITITISTPDKKINETVEAELNPNFNDEKEIVIRKTDFASQRTLAIRSDKAAFGLNKSLIEFLKKKENEISVIIESIDF